MSTVFAKLFAEATKLPVHLSRIYKATENFQNTNDRIQAWKIPDSTHDSKKFNYYKCAGFFSTKCIWQRTWLFF